MTPFQQFKADFSGKKVLIFGLGLQGRGVGDAQVFAKLGAKVTVTDQKTEADLAPSLHQLAGLEITYALSGHQQADILAAQVIIRNASVPWNHPLLELARQHHIPIKMDAALFFAYARPLAIAVTGTRGKSTTTTLISELLQAAGQNPILGGNITPAASLSFLENYRPTNFYVFELSSWQLQAFHQEKISPPIAVVTNLYPDHLLDRTYAQYVHDKTAIFAHQRPTDHLFLNAADPLTPQLKDQAKGIVDFFDAFQVPASWQPQLKGDHNRANIAAALKVAALMGVTPATAQTTVESFSPLPYRLEPITTINRVTIINDTTSTTPAATIAALKAYPGSILILGGASKRLPIEDLVNTVNTLSGKILLLPGTGTNEIKSRLDSTKVLGEFSSLPQILDQALRMAKPGSTILFSPGFTSFGQFHNEFDRGQQFNQAVSSYQHSPHHDTH